MFGMNEKDALECFEDVTRIRLANSMADRAQEAQHQAARINQGLRVRDDFIAKQRREFKELMWERNLEVVHVRALTNTLKQAIADLAKVTGKPVAELEHRFAVLRTAHFNAEINSAMSTVKDVFEQDPRLAMSDTVKAWYVRGLDADHGF